MTDVTTRTNGIHPAINEHYDAMNEALHERDQLRTELQKTTNELAIEQGKNKFLQEQLERVTNERDRYLRFNFELTSRMNSIRGIMDNMFETSAHIASDPPRLNEQELLEKLRPLTVDEQVAKEMGGS